MGVYFVTKKGNMWTRLPSDAVWGEEEITDLWGSGGVNTV